tara:strand:- start:273 stop:1493 length:1221 start_codon:yes stop_codon:yes gene_type:complete
MALTKIPGELINIDDLDLTNVGTLHLDSIVSDASPAVITVGNGINDTTTILGTTNIGTGFGQSPEVGGKLKIGFANSTSHAASSATTASNSALVVGNYPGVEAANLQAAIQFNVHGGSQNRVASIAAVAEASDSNLTSLAFHTDEGSNRTEKMRITGAGKVGIGVIPSGSWDANIDCLQVGEQSSLWAGDTDYTDATWLGTNVYQTGGTTKYLTTGVASVYGMQGGQHYWYTYASGSADATVSGNEVMRIDTNGHVTMPLQSSAMVQLSGDQSNLATTPTTITFDTERFDQNGDFNNTSNSPAYAFVAPTTGRYLVCVNLYMKNIDNAASYYQLYVQSSNRTYYSIFDPNHIGAGGDGDPTYWDMQWAGVIDMDENDNVYFRMNQSGGSAQTDIDQVSHASVSLLH